MQERDAIPSVETERDILIKQIIEFNERIFAYEDSLVSDLEEDIIPLLKVVQERLQIPSNVDLLESSLNYLMEAETIDEMDVYRAGFLAGLEAVKPKDILDIDSCVYTMREIVDTFHLKIKDPNQAENNAFLVNRALKAKEKMDREADALIQEFSKQMEANELIASQLDSSQANQIKLKSLHEQHLKFEEGIKRIQDQKKLVNGIYETVRKFPYINTEEEYRRLRQDYGDDVVRLRTGSPQLVYNNIVHKAQEKINHLYELRSSYLGTEADARFKENLGAISFLGQSVGSLFLPDVASRVQSFSELAIETSGLKNSIVMNEKIPVKLGVRKPQELPKPTMGQRVVGWLKKGFSLLLGAGQLFCAALLCLSGFGIPAGLALAATAIGVIGAVAGGSDYITELKRTQKKAKEVISKVEELEELYENIPNEKSNQAALVEQQMSIPQVPKPKMTSEAKIDVLLMGHQPHEVLDQKEVLELRKKYAERAKAKQYITKEPLHVVNSDSFFKDSHKEEAKEVEKKDKENKSDKPTNHM